jgi:hypothetical protein
MTAPAQAPPPATQGWQGLDRPRGGDALAPYLEAIRRNPNDADLHYHLAVAYAKEGRLEQAMVTYRKALALKPDHPGAREGLLALTRAAGHEPGASPALQERAPGLPDGVAERATDTAPGEPVNPPPVRAVEPPPVAAGPPSPEPDASFSAASGATRPETPGAPPEPPVPWGMAPRFLAVYVQVWSAHHQGISDRLHVGKLARIWSLQCACALHTKTPVELPTSYLALLTSFGFQGTRNTAGDRCCRRSPAAMPASIVSREIGLVRAPKACV